MDITSRTSTRTGAACHPAALSPDELAAEIDFVAARRSGPGGQNRNKVETAVILTHRPTGTKAEASERRTQGENRRVALLRLRIELALTFRLPIRRDEHTRYEPTLLWRKRCARGRLEINPGHEDYPALLAEALDVICACGDEPKAAADELGCTPSQLIKFLKESPRALGLVNERRRRAGRHVLR
ncbi:MAG: peptide chain release factor family protein [Isosphaeraceae bacterium]